MAEIKSTSRDNLGYLGPDFQYKLVKAFMDDHKFFVSINNIIDHNMFTESSLRTYVGVLKEYYESHEMVPSYQLMEIELRSKSQNDIQIQFYIDTLNKIKETSNEGIDSIIEISDKFFKQQNLTKAINRISKFIENGDYDKYYECEDIIRKALEVGAEDEMGIGVFDNMEEVLSDDYRCPIPTGIGKIDETLEGGLGKGELGIVLGPSSFGKALSVNSLVATPNGFVRNGDLKVGDYVIGKNGKPTKVIGVFPQGKRDMYRVTFSDGVSCVCDIEHLWNVNSWYQRCGKKYVKGSYSKEGYNKVYQPDYSFKTLTLKEIMEKGLYYEWGNKKIYNFKIPMCEPVHFNNIPVKIDPYVMGLMIGDGNFKSGVITVGNSDSKEIISILNEKEHSFVTHVKEKRNNINSLAFGTNFTHLLSEYYDTTSVAHQKFIHHDYLYNSLDNRIELLNGLMDSDGTCQKNGCSCYNTKSKQLAEDVKQLVLSLGGFAIVREKKCGYFNKKYNEYRDCGTQYEVTITLCDPSIPIFKLKRKQDRVHYRNLRKGERFIKSVEFECNEEAQCIKVDAEDELYLTDDFIVTHNTSLTTAMASHAATFKCDKNDFKGFKVLQIVFEDREKQIQRKHLGRIANVEAKDLSKPDFKEQVMKSINDFEDYELIKNNIRIIRFQSGEKTASQIRQFIKKMINSGYKPDLVIVDYFECVKLEAGATAGDNEWSREGITMRKFESMANELDIALWVPIQGTKDSLGAELVTMSQGGGSVKKIQIGHIIMSIARTMESIELNLATIAILKNRSGKAGKVFNNVEFNNGTCRISTDNIDEFNMVEYNEDKQKQREMLAKEVISGLGKK